MIFNIVRLVAGYLVSVCAGRNRSVPTGIAERSQETQEMYSKLLEKYGQERMRHRLKLN